MAIRYYTTADAIQHLIDAFGTTAKASEQRRRRSAIAAAYRDVARFYPWSYLTKHERLTFTAPYSTGTVSYDHTGSVSGERIVSLAGGTFPTWAGRATIVFGSIEYDVQKRIDGTTLQLTENSNPGDDVGGSAFVIYRDKYLLPQDFLRGDRVFKHDNRQGLVYTAPADYFVQRSREKSTGTPKYYTFMGDEDDTGRMMARVWPLPTAALTVDYAYLRQPRQLLFDEYSAGTISIASAAVTGVLTSFTEAMIGSVIRISFSGAQADETTGDTAPQWFERMAMPMPYIYERRITAVGSGTALTLDSAPGNVSSVLYQISDPIDLEPGLMLTSFIRAMEAHYAAQLADESAQSRFSLFGETIKAAVENERGRNLHQDWAEDTQKNASRAGKTSTQAGGL